MALGVAQHQARSLGHDQCIGIAYTAALEVELLGRERNVHILLYIFGIDDNSILAHADFVKDLAQQRVERAKLARQLGEVDAPLADRLARKDNAVIVKVAQIAYQLAATQQYLALAAIVARERLSHQLHQLLAGE